MLHRLATLCCAVVAGSVWAATDSVSSHISKASELRTNLDHEQALAELEKAKRLPHSQQDDINIGMCEGLIWAELANWDQASRSFRAALELDRDATILGDVAPKIRQFIEQVRAKVPPSTEGQVISAAARTSPGPAASSPAGGRSGEASAGPWRHLTISGQAFGDVMSNQLGAEVAVGVRGPLLDAKFGAVIGGNLGFQIDVGAHLDVMGPLALRLGLRAAYHSLPGGVALGGGLSFGPSYELGPGRVTASFAAHLYSTPANYRPLAAFILGGYEVDL